MSDTRMYSSQVLTSIVRASPTPRSRLSAVHSTQMYTSFLSNSITTSNSPSHIGELLVDRCVTRIRDLLPLITSFIIHNMYHKQTFKKALHAVIDSTSDSSTIPYRLRVAVRDRVCPALRRL